MDHDNQDLLRPSHHLATRTLTRSRSKWHSLLESAQSATSLPYSCCNIKALLNRTPSIPQFDHIVERVGAYSLSIQGYSSWSVSPVNKRKANNGCELPPIKRAFSRDVYIGQSHPNTCSLSEDNFPVWSGFQPLREPVGNYLCFFVLGLSYILSARLVELRRATAEDRVVYTSNKAQWDIDDKGRADDHFSLDIGTDDYAEVRWWAAILAGGCGWQAILVRDGKEYYMPWECHLNSSAFMLHWHHPKLPHSIPALEPPSSVKAQEYLFNFARRYDAFDQLIGALAAVITLPSHNRFGAPITLPKPTRGPISRQNTELIYASQIPTTAELPHFMALSCISGLLASCLFGCFWEPGIPCNLASQWLNPAMKEIFPFYIKSKKFGTIINAMSQRRPSIASLWLGSAVTGLLPRIFQVSRSFLPMTYLEAVTWTSSSQSFMDPRYHRPTPIQRIDGVDMIPREDEFRLLFVTDTCSKKYRNPPLSPYAPFGLMNIEHTSLDVRLHILCNHRLAYHSWNWQCQNDQVLPDHGASPGSNPRRLTLRSALCQFLWIMAGVTLVALPKPYSGIRVLLRKGSGLNDS